MQNYLARFAAGFGVAGLRSSPRLPNTRRAIALAEVAREAGRLRAFREAAMLGYWQQGLDLEDPTDLAALVQRAGLPPEALQQAEEPRILARVDELREEAHDRGVSGIPTFFIGDGPPVVGCQPYEALAAAAAAAGAAPRPG